MEDNQVASLICKCDRSQEKMLGCVHDKNLKCIPTQYYAFLANPTWYKYPIMVARINPKNTIRKAIVSYDNTT